MAVQNANSFAREMLKLALKNENTPSVSFAARWSCFDFLYNQSVCYGEIERIADFCGEQMDVLLQFDAFQQEGILPFYAGPIEDARPFSRQEARVLTYQQLCDGKRTRAQRTVSLMHSLYFVRSNMFRGNERLYDERGQRLLGASSALLRGFLEELKKTGDML